MTGIATGDSLDASSYAAKKARQGVRYVTLEGLDVLDPQTLEPVPADGRDDGRGDDARQCGDEGLSEEPGRHAKGLCRGLVPFR